MNPIALGLGVGSSIVGGLIGQKEASKNARAIAEARNSVLLESLQKQKKYAEENRGTFDARMGDYAPGAQDKALTGAQDERTATSLGAITAPTDGSEIALSRSAPTAVRGEFAKRMLSAFNHATERAKASGKLGGYGDTWQGNNIGINDAGRRISTVNNFAQGENAMLNDQMDFAQVGATKAPSLWGPIFSAGGNLLAGAAGRGGMPSFDMSSFGFNPVSGIAG